MLSAVRGAIGPDVALLFFVETPLWPDDLAGHRRLAEEQPIPITSGEWLTTRHEHADLMDRGKVAFAQPDIGRVGGLTEAMKVCDLAAERGVRIVPHLWKTGISIAAAAHLAAVTPHCDFIEFLPTELSESGLRKDLTRDEVEMVDGAIPLPTRPGLGVEIDRDVLAAYASEARRVETRHLTTPTP